MPNAKIGGRGGGSRVLPWIWSWMINLYLYIVWALSIVCVEIKF